MTERKYKHDVQFVECYWMLNGCLYNYSRSEIFTCHWRAADYKCDTLDKSFYYSLNAVVISPDWKLRVEDAYKGFLVPSVCFGLSSMVFWRLLTRQRQ
jgi:hypothetical protein